MIQLTSIGRLGKPYGVSGQLRLRLECDVNLSSQRFLFVRILGDKVPYEIEEIEEGLVKFTEVDSPEVASSLSGRELYVESKFVAESSSNPDYLLGFEVYSDGEPVGIIEAIQEFPQQIMAIVMQGANQHYIPMVEEWIVKIDVESCRLHMELPNGLLTLNMDSGREEE